MEFEMKHERGSNWQFPIHWIENGANDTNEIDEGGTKCRGIFGLICLVNIFTGILLTKHEGGGGDTQIS